MYHYSTLAAGSSCSYSELDHTDYEQTTSGLTARRTVQNQYYVVPIPQTSSILQWGATTLPPNAGADADSGQYIVYGGYTNTGPDVVPYIHTRTTTLDAVATTVETYNYDPGFTNAQPFCALTDSVLLQNCDWVMTARSNPTLGKLSSVTTTGPDGKGGTVTSTRTISYKAENSNGIADPTYYAANLLDFPTSITLSGSGSNGSTTTYNYDEANGSPAGTRSNLTSTSITGPNGGYTSTGTVYDLYGMPKDKYDGNNNHTILKYDDPQSASPTSITSPTTNGVAHTESYTWDPKIGTMKSFTDQNGVITQFTRNDPLGRLTLVDSAVGKPEESQKRFTYPDARTVNTYQDKNSVGDGAIATTTRKDGFGRVTDVINPVGATVHTTYDSVGNVASVSNPYFSMGDPTYGITSFAYDALGRKTLQCDPDNGTGSSECIGKAAFREWTYNGNTVTVQDEAGVQSQQTIDALGRLTNVVEPGSLSTDYTYDNLGNLQSVNQKGASGDTPRARNFSYDSLSHLVTSTNPETGTICYGLWSSNGCSSGYDLNGNLRYKTDARGITTTFDYDALNRLTSKTASDGSFNYSYLYDESGHSNSIGRLTTSSNNINGGETYSYDAMGRVSQESYCVPTDCSLAKNVLTTYDLAGNLATLTYPDGRTITRRFDSAGRLSSITYTAWNENSHNSPYLTVATTNGYDPASHLINATMGNNVALAAQYDNRERLGSLVYGTTAQPLWGKTYGYWANSNLQSTTDVVTGIQRQLGYDSLNRLTIAQDFIPNAGAGSGTTSETGSSCTTGTGGGSSGAGPEWTNEDDSNGLQNPKAPGGDGWLVGNTTVAQNAAVAPDGSMSATTLTATAGSPDSFISDPLVQPSDYYSTSVTGSVWIKSLTGNQNLDLFIVELTNSGSVVVASKQVQLTGSWQQYQLTATLPGGFNQMVMQIGGGGTLTSGQSIAVWDTKLEDTGSAGRTVTNFLPYSQQFARWASAAGGVTDNAASAPDGTQTAASFTGPSGVGDSYIIQSVANPAPFSGQQVTGSVWIRSTTGTQNLLLTLIEIGASGWSTLGLETVSLSGDWQRFQVSGATQSTLSQLALQIGGGGTIGSGQTIQVWGGQLELASTAGPYVPTGAVAASRGTNLTNLLPFSQQVNGPSWGIAAGTRTSSAVTAPDGSATGTEITANSGSTDSYLVNDVQNPALYNGATVTGSVFLKAPGGSQSFDLFLFAENSSGRTFLGIQTVQLTSTWQRFSITGQLPNGLTRFALQVGGGSTFTSGQVIDVWGSQLELASAAGPYIATSTLPVVVGQELKNILPNSEQLSGPSWGVAAGSITTNSGTAPDGSRTAATLTSAASSTDSYVVDSVPNPSYYDGQTMTGSVYLRVPSGSLNTNIYLVNIGENGFGLVAARPVTVTSTWQRFQITGANQNGLTTFLLQVGGGSTIGGGQTLQIWGAQMVVGTTAGSYGATSCTGTNLVTGQPGTLAPDGLNQTYIYDSFGNLLQNGGFNNGDITANNQFYGYPYDAAGNLLSTGYMSLTWDAESKLTATGAGASYIYDANGDRVEKQGIGVTDTFYFGGRPIARLSAGQWTDLIYGPSGLLAEVPGTESSSPTYRLTDHLGNSVGEVGDNGLLTNPMDYTPFGQVFSGSTSDPYLFTGKERDSESGLDYFGARYFGSTMGRFMSPDFGGPIPNMPDPVPWADFENPQSLNLYSYGFNNPLSNTDSDGHDVNICDNNGNCHQVSNEEYQKAQQGNNGGLNVPTLDQVGSNGNGSGQFNSTAITDSSGNTVGTATYVSNGNLDYYANANGYQQLATASRATNQVTAGYAIVFGAVGGGMLAADVALGSELTTLGEIGTTPTAGQTAQAEMVLEQSGKKGVEKAIQTLEKRIAQHLEKLDQFQKAGGYTSKTQSEIQNFKSLIRAYQSVLK